MHITPHWAETVIKSRVRGFDALAVIPVPELDEASGFVKASGLAEAASCAYAAMEKGLIPESYGWTREKTARAYGLEGYGSWAQCVIVAAKYYCTDDDVAGSDVRGAQPSRDTAFGRIARFTWRNNYRYLVLRLREAVSALEAALGRQIKSKVLSNYTSIPEKALFRLSGLADVGKHGVLIHPAMGSYFTVGEAFCGLRVDGAEDALGAGQPPVVGQPPVLAPGSNAAQPHVTGLRLTPPRFDLCGECRLCRDACPTGAIPWDGAVNVTRCFQYMSENLTLVPASDREKWGSRVYGCSDCIDACPFNKGLTPWGEKHGVGYVGPGFDLLDLLTICEAEWRERFRDNQIGKRDRRAVLKNVILSLGWLEYRKAVPSLLPFLEHDHEVLRTCAAWALVRIGTTEGKLALERLARRERSAVVREEIERFL
jgi:epoxyqueuosine reductase QueG